LQPNDRFWQHCLKLIIHQSVLMDKLAGVTQQIAFPCLKVKRTTGRVQYITANVIRSLTGSFESLQGWVRDLDLWQVQQFDTIAISSWKLWLRVMHLMQVNHPNCPFRSL
jgi:hypothetical protein